MKIYLLLLLFLLFLTGCMGSNVSIQTEVKNDGSIIRIYRFDEEDDVKSFYPVMETGNERILRIETINKEATNDTSASPVTIVKYIYFYKNVKALNKDLMDAYQGDKIPINVKLKKSFNFLYTYYEYEEELKRINTFPDDPLLNYITKETIQKYVKEELTEDEGNKFILKCFEWLQKNILKEMKAIIINKYPEDPVLLKGFNKLEQSINSAYINAERSKDFDNQLSSGSFDSYVEFLVANGVPKEIFTNGEVEKYNSDIEKLKQKHDVIYNSLLYSYIEGQEISLPGKIVKSNANAVRNNVMIYNSIPIISLFIEEFKIEGVSRSLNIWFMVLSTTIILLGFGLLIIKVFRKER